jgi:hypothetical protein
LHFLHGGSGVVALGRLLAPRRRAKENSVDFIEGVATAITPLAFLETIMVKGYQTLVDERTSVSYRDGMEAALKLAEALRKDEGADERAQMMEEMGRIIEVVRTFIPSERWPDVQATPRRNSCIPADIAGGSRGAHGGHRRHPGRGRQLMAANLWRDFQGMVADGRSDSRGTGGDDRSGTFGL